MKRTRIIIGIITALALCYVLYCRFDEFRPAKDEIAVHAQLNTKEDIGLLVYDYDFNDKEYSGGISNADGSMIKHDSDNILVFDKDELGASSKTVQLKIRFRIITEYVSPNFDNIYPDDITVRLEPVELKARFGESYHVTITGDKKNGYQAVVDQNK